jgi:hypothetical protein
VVADNAAAKADPGVMLKITPPVASRQGDVSVPQHAMPGEVAQALADMEAERAGEIKALVGTASDADEAVATRFAQALAALPSDVQEAIRQASTPAIAKLLRLAAMTAPGIKEAPAWVHTGEQALAQSPQDAAQALLAAIKHAPPFELAAALKALLTPRAAADTSAQQQRAAQPGPQQPATGAPASQPTNLLQAAAQQSALNAQASAAALAALDSAPTAANASPNASANAGPNAGPNEAANAGPNAAANASLAASPSNAAAANQAQGLLGTPQSYPGSAQAMTGLGANAQSALGNFFDSLVLQGSADARQPVGQAGQPNPQMPLLVASPHAEAGMRDALRLLMDGRLMWQGQFTEGVPMRFERSDAWRASRRSTGGMEKGSSIRITLELPKLGRLEVSGLGFGGQVSLRVQAEDGATSTMVQALPKLQAKLRERGLAGAQVVIESRVA